MQITNEKLIKKIVQIAKNTIDEIDFDEKIYNMWINYDVTDDQADLLDRAKICGPATIANTFGDCL
jgi:hypothetical protein